MRLNPFGYVSELRERIDDLETREGSYTDAIIASLTQVATGETKANSTATAAVEACSGLVARAFVTAEIESTDTIQQLITPACLAMIGRELIRHGEILYLIDLTDGVLDLLPVQTYEIDGGHRRDSWVYKVTIVGPDQTTTYETVRSDGIIHLTYATEPGRPWKGISPLTAAHLSGRLSAETIAALGDESSGPRGQFVPIPVDGADASVNALKKDIRTAGGAALVVESGDWDNTGSGRDDSFNQRRFGANPPSALVQLADLASREIYAACGVPAVLFAAGGQAAATRESYRQFLHSTVAPLGKLVAAELALKLDNPVTFGWGELRAADISGRARAFQSMVVAGMDLAKAAQLSGLMASE